MTPHKHNETGDPPCTDRFSARHSFTLSQEDKRRIPSNQLSPASWQALHTREGLLPFFPASLLARRFRLRQAPEWKGCQSLGCLSSPSVLCHSFPRSALEVPSAGLAGCLSCIGPLTGLTEHSVDGSWNGEFQGGRILRYPQATMWERIHSPASGALCPPTSSNTNSFCVETRLQSVHDTHRLCAMSFISPTHAGYSLYSLLPSKLILSIPLQEYRKFLQAVFVRQMVVYKIKAYTKQAYDV